MKQTNNQEIFKLKVNNEQILKSPFRGDFGGLLMKRSALLFISALASILSFAQPSRTEMLERVKNEYEHVSAELVGPGGVDSENKDGRWVDYFTQPFRVKQKTEYPNVYYSYKASLRYRLTGDKWMFHQFTVGGGHFEGLPEPDRNEIIKMIHQDLSKILNQDYNKIVGEVSEFTFPEDPEWYWRKVTYVEFKVKATYSTKYSYTELEKAEHTIRIAMLRDAINSPWNKIDGIVLHEKDKKLGRTKYTEDELKKMPTLAKLADEKLGHDEFNKLPKVPDAPIFASDKQLFYYLHEKFLTESPQAMEAYIFKVLDKSCFEPNSDILVHARVADWINHLVANAAAYKAAYCPTPAVKHYQTGQIEFFDREMRNFVTYTAKQSGNTWKMIDFRFVPANASDFDRLKTNYSNCQAQPDLEVKEVVSYQVGDKVNVQFSNGTFPCTIDKLDPDNSNRYFVKIDTDKSGRGYWMDDTFISKRGGNAGNAVKQALNNLGSKITAFKVGDQVEVNTSAGWLKAQVVQNLGVKFKVKFANPQIADMWVTKDLMR